MYKHNKNKNNLALISRWIINSTVKSSLNIMTGLVHERKIIKQMKMRKFNYNTDSRTT